MAELPIELPLDRRFLFVGAGPAFACFLETFQKWNAEAGHAASVYSGSELHRRWSVAGDEGLQALCGRLALPLIDIDDDSNATLQKAIAQTGANVGLVVGWNRIIGKDAVEPFAGRLFNVHTGPLPRYRGAGGFSWQVLNNEPSVTMTVHQMTEGLDDGPILLQRELAVAGDSVLPRDIFAIRERLYRSTVFPKLCQLLVEANILTLAPMDMTKATYFPLLKTAENGVADFAWSPTQFCRFVHAFSDPYPGALFRYRSHRFHVRRCAVIEENADYHPFCRGLITNVQEDGIACFVNGGIVQLSAITDLEGATVPYHRFREGERLYNTKDDLEQAMLFRARPL